MINTKDILETINMVKEENLDIRTVTMGISLLDCAAGSAKEACDRIYDKITGKAGKLVCTAEQIETEYGIPIINKRNTSASPKRSTARQTRSASTSSAATARSYRRALPAQTRDS